MSFSWAKIYLCILISWWLCLQMPAIICICEAVFVGFLSFKHQPELHYEIFCSLLTYFNKNFFIKFYRRGIYQFDLRDRNACQFLNFVTRILSFLEWGNAVYLVWPNMTFYHLLLFNLYIKGFVFSHITNAGLILGLRPANERRRYTITPSLIGWAQTQNKPWNAP